jgi:hypothetical protein
VSDASDAYAELLADPEFRDSGEFDPLAHRGDDATVGARRSSDARRVR